MQTLRHSLILARFVLVWFALSVGVAIASPMVNPKGVDMVCSSAGVMKLVVQGQGDDSDGAERGSRAPNARPAVSQPAVSAERRFSHLRMVHSPSRRLEITEEES